ncbi:hypothetical protein [Rosenbergiella australiborealis]|uniref:hypothetical protein n=1 Tax=Rosenbergiella australiborealis TaxID=1544696 RepID=UPI001F4E6B44|nr:hypothetical protein [Rosenbergiella australiborealis]
MATFVSAYTQSICFSISSVILVAFWILSHAARSCLSVHETAAYRLGLTELFLHLFWQRTPAGGDIVDSSFAELSHGFEA